MKHVLTLALFLLTFSSISARNRQTTLFLAGDESMAKPTATAIIGQQGWGEALKDCFDDKLNIENLAQAGCGSSSFITRHYWDSLLNKVQKGDVVLIQFGHHEKDTSLYRYNMLRMAHDVRLKKAIPVLVTPIYSNQSDNETEHYATIIRRMEKELDIALVDLWRLGADSQHKSGNEQVQSLYIVSLESNNILLTESGAWETANLAAQAFSKENIKPLKKYLLSKKARQEKHSITIE